MEGCCFVFAFLRLTGLLCPRAVAIIVVARAIPRAGAVVLCWEQVCWLTSVMVQPACSLSFLEVGVGAVASSDGWERGCCDVEPQA